MQRGWWKEPVQVRQGGITYQVTNAAQAGRMLLDAEWPDTDLSRAARRACLSAMENGNAEKARAAFAAAVAERMGL